LLQGFVRFSRSGFDHAIRFRLTDLRHSAFVIVSSFELRHSDLFIYQSIQFFGFRDGLPIPDNANRRKPITYASIRPLVRPPVLAGFKRTAWQSPGSPGPA
jgi:hypothetical protein